MIAFTAIALYCIRTEGVRLPLAFNLLFGLFLLYGIWAVALSVFKLDPGCTGSYVVGGFGAAGFGVFAILVAVRFKDGWSGGVPFVPEGWNQSVARVLFGLGGLFCWLAAVRIFRKAINQYRKKEDDGVRPV